MERRSVAKKPASLEETKRSFIPVLALLLLVTFFGVGSNHPCQSVPQSTPSAIQDEEAEALAAGLTVVPGTPIESPTPAPSPASRPLLTGSYAGSFGVAPNGDPFKHFSFIGPMPTALDVSLTRIVETGVITLVISGSPPFVTVTSVGNYNVDTGAFVGEGSGTFTSRNIPGTEHMEGTLLNGRLNATMSINGLPNGPITYLIDMIKISGP
ncbi:MAG TPA: hypothetical protein VNL15_03520 [Dehalococcoidia bacterium]|nr:hypothetical protein [Dehalococcoidia bacterium]